MLCVGNDVLRWEWGGVGDREGGGRRVGISLSLHLTPFVYEMCILRRFRTSEQIFPKEISYRVFFFLHERCRNFVK